jgi:hypothetical protein
MHNLLDGFLVGSALLASAFYAVSALGPRALRARGLAALANGSRRLPGNLGSGILAQRLRSAAAAAAATDRKACGGCANCGSENDARQAKSPAGEVSIALHRIGRVARPATVPGRAIVP